jgi:hypothetical protein
VRHQGNAFTPPSVSTFSLWIFYKQYSWPLKVIISVCRENLLRDAHEGAC